MFTGFKWLPGTALMAWAAVTTASAGVIDFDSAAPGIANPYVEQGVVIQANQIGAILREAEYYTCVDPGSANQLFEASIWSCLPFNCCPAIVDVLFPPPPATPVHSLSVEVHGTVPVLELVLYDANDAVLVTARSRPDPMDCTLGVRAVLTGASEQRVARAEIWNPGDPLPPGDGGCPSGSLMQIDNLFFDGGAVPAKAASWGDVKVRYR